MTSTRLFSSSIALLSVLFIPLAQANFPDTVDHRYSTQIHYAQAAGIVSGNPDGTYKPDATIDRAAFTKIVVEAILGSVLDIEACLEENPTFDIIDVPRDAWFASYFCVAVVMEIMAGYPDGSIGPERNINYAESAKILANAYNLDVSPTDVWYEGFIAAIEALDARPPTVSGPEHLVTRGEMAFMIFALDNSSEDMNELEIEEVSLFEEVGYMNYYPEVLGNGEPGVLFFNAAWCPLCRNHDALLTEIDIDGDLDVDVYSVDYDEYTDLRVEFGVTQQHTFVVLDGEGNAIDTVVGPTDTGLRELVAR